MSAFSRTLKVGNIDSFTLDVSTWAGSETITSLAVTEADGALVTIGASTFSSGNLTVLLTGVAVGEANIHFEYTTLTRRDCYKSIVIVIAGC